MKRTLLGFLLALASTAAAQAPSATASSAPGVLGKNLEAYLRKLYAWGPTFQVKVGKLTEAELPGFYRFAVEVAVGSQSDTAVMYVSKDGRHVIRGEVLDTTADPFAANRQQIRLEGRPSRGSKGARVVVVDFSDYQCPHCRELDKTLRELRPQYPQVRFVSKHFPLSHIHPWAMTAAFAGECAYRQNAEGFWKVHDAIFDQQETITAENAWQKMLEIAAAAGLDPDSFRGCMVSPEAKQAVEQDLKEGQAVRIANTPTVFINGRRLVGGDPNLLKQYIEYELVAGPPPRQP